MALRDTDETVAEIATAREQRRRLAEAASIGDSLYANRVRVYPKSVKGIARTLKWAVLAACLAVYYLTPWMRWDRGEGLPDQAILIDIAGRRAWFFDLEIWPQEIYFLTGLLILAAIGLFFVTSLFGRLWCGYTCPQTVWTDLFMLIERWVEGDRNQRMRLDRSPLSWDKTIRKSVKHAIWLLIAAATGGAWIMYYTDAPTVTHAILTGAASTQVYFFFGLFTASTYLLAGHAREQVCTYMCPWPRFQAAMLDEHTYTVTYEAWRGEPRGKHKAGQSWEGRGDCIDCRQCVAVCPTGIDIRDGIQLECINCGLCIDACNDVMTKVGRPPWLITWDTEANQKARARGEAPRTKLLRLRTIIYFSLLMLVGIAMMIALATKSTVAFSALHDRAPLFVTLSDGTIRNGYTLKLLNKDREARTFIVTIDGIEGAEIALQGADGNPIVGDRVDVAAQSQGSFRLFVRVERGRLEEAQSPVTITVTDAETGESASADTRFSGPAG